MTLTPNPDADPPDAARTVAFASVFTSNLPPILRELRSSLLVTTYQTGKLIVVRPDGASLNTHFVDFRKPMGLAADRDRLIRRHRHRNSRIRNVPDVAARLTRPGATMRSTCFATTTSPATSTSTKWRWASATSSGTSTRASPACARSTRTHSFVPRWRPRFIIRAVARRSLPPERPRDGERQAALADRAGRHRHRAGLARQQEGWRRTARLRDSRRRRARPVDAAQPALVSRPAVGAGIRPRKPRAPSTSPPAGSRPSHACRDSRADLSFLGPLAFIGLSQLRETNAFTDIPITEENADRMSGVWVVNIETGQTDRLPQIQRRRAGDLRRACCWADGSSPRSSTTTTNS